SQACPFVRFRVSDTTPMVQLRIAACCLVRTRGRATAREAFFASDLKHQMRNVWFDPRKVGALREESPNAYKDVRAVLRAQGELVRATRTLRPLLVYKTG